MAAGLRAGASLNVCKEQKGLWPQAHRAACVGIRATVWAQGAALWQLDKRVTLELVA